VHARNVHSAQSGLISNTRGECVSKTSSIGKVIHCIRFCRLDATTQRFDSVCGVETCAGNTGGREEGTVTSGRDTGNGANVTVPFIRGDINTRMQ